MSLFQSGSKSVQFTNVGDSVTGTVDGVPYERQATTFGTQNPAFYPDGNPVMDILVPLQTTLQSDGNDDGKRTLYVSSARMKRAIYDAIKQAGVPDVAVGGTLTVKFLGNDPNSKNPANPAKLYQAQYTPPASGFVAPAGQAPAPQAVPAQQVSQMSQQAPAAPAAAQAPAPAHGLSADQVSKLQQLRAAGIREDVIATAIEANPAQIAAFDATPF